MKKRFLSFVLACCMTIGLLPALSETAHAISTTTVPSGYVGIYTAKDLDAIHNDLDGKYILMNDIDLSEWGAWTPIRGKGQNFSGVFDGNGYAVKGMFIDDSSVPYAGSGYTCAGLFSSLEGATVRDIRYVSGKIIIENTSSIHIGGIAGDAYGATISKCASYVEISYKRNEPTGQAYTSVGGIGFVGGGIVGCVRSTDNLETTVISECSNHAAISGISDCAPMDVGGIVGSTFAFGNAVIENCYNRASLSAKTGYVSSDVGGIVGSSYKVEISNSYNVGSPFICEVGSTDRMAGSPNVGGIAGNVAGNSGYTTITNCVYSNTAKAAVGYGTGGNSKAVVLAKSCSPQEMESKSCYSGFDFSNTWKMGSSSFPYPVLRWTLGGNPSCTHKYTSAGGNICTVCGYEFEPELIEYNKTLYAAIENAAVRNQPYAKAGTLVDKLAKGEAVRVTHYFYNSLGSKWYKTENGNYIYSERLTSVGSGARTYTLSFNANGSGVTNLPASVSIREGVRYGIPGVASKPQRTGYNFLGYSTSKNAATAEYVPGKSIMLTSDLTLYAVWEKRETNLVSVPGVAQDQNGDKGTCTTAATAVILSRRLVVDGKYDEIFTYKDVRKSCNNSFAIKNMTNSKTGNGNTTYSLKKETLSSLRGNGQSIMEHIIKLLDLHPEGVVFYYNYGNDGHHAIVLSDYELKSDGTYQLYAYDSGTSNMLGRMKLEDTYSWKKSFGSGWSYQDFFLKANDGHKYFKCEPGAGYCVWYIDREV